jgi:hypothetical protein
LSPQPVALHEILDVIAEFGEASPELVAWELQCHVAEVAPAWGRALAEGLLANAHIDTMCGEEMWALSLRGRARLHESRRAIAG